MATQVQRRRGTTAEHATFTGAEGELTVDTTKDTVVVHDGSTAGGFAVLREDLANNASVVTTTGTQTLTNKSISADQVNSGTVATARLGSGTADSTTFLRGDQTWATVTLPSTDFDGVGAYAVAYYAASPGISGASRMSWLARGTTTAGSNLRVNSRASGTNSTLFTETGINPLFGMPTAIGTTGNSTAFPTTNTTTLSGTWRLMHTAVTSSTSATNVENEWVVYYTALLWVRIS
jgi:hypothetical protein